MSAMAWSRLAVRSARSGILSRAPHRVYSPALSSLVSSRTSGDGNVSPPIRTASASPKQPQPVERSKGPLKDPKTKRTVKTTGTRNKFSIELTNSLLKVVDRDEASRPTNGLPYVWLRDSCRCSQCVNQDTMQRKLNIFDLPDLSAVRPKEIQEKDDGVNIIWAHEDHETFYNWGFLERHGFTERTNPVHHESQQKLWGSEIAHDPPTVEYHEVMDSSSKSGMAKLTNHLMQSGLVFVNGTPFDDPIHTKRLLERIGPIRETHYGGFYDFIPDMAKADTAYTNIALAAHTDTTYFTDPAGLQAFHMLSHTPPPGATDGEQPSGGKSLLVDGFHAAKELRNSFPTYYRELLLRLPWHASGNEGVAICPDWTYPVIELERPSTRNRKPMLEREIGRIRWNNDDRAIFRCSESEGINRITRPQRRLLWYKAAAQWTKILKSSSSEFWFQLKPGQTLIFDNYRVLHGRSAFTGMRRMCGAYINHDDFRSCWRNANFTREEIHTQVIGV